MYSMWQGISAEFNNVQNVANPLPIIHFLLNINESTLGRDLVNVQNMAKPLTSIWVFLYLSELILGRNHTNVTNVAKPLSIVHILLDINESILGRDLINVQTLAKPFPRVQVFLDIREFILQRNVRRVRNVAKDFITAITSLPIREYILQRNPRNESVIKKIDPKYTILKKWVFTLERYMNEIQKCRQVFNQTSQVNQCQRIHTRKHFIHTIPNECHSTLKLQCYDLFPLYLRTSVFGGCYLNCKRSPSILGGNHLYLFSNL